MLRIASRRIRFESRPQMRCAARPTLSRGLPTPRALRPEGIPRTSPHVSQVTDDAKKFIYDRRIKLAQETRRNEAKWSTETKANELKVLEEARSTVDRLKLFDEAARVSKAQVKEVNAAKGVEERARVKVAQAAKAQRQAELAATIKMEVNTAVAARFASPSKSRRMLRHPKYPEVSS